MNTLTCAVFPRVEHDTHAKELQETFAAHGVSAVRKGTLYALSRETAFDKSLVVSSVLSEPPIDEVFSVADLDTFPGWVCIVEPLPGQYDQRADFAAKCTALLSGTTPQCKSADVYLFEGKIGGAGKTAIKKALVNPLDSRVGAIHDFGTFEFETAPTSDPDMAFLDRFLSLSETDLLAIGKNLGLAMNLSDLLQTQSHFTKLGRDPRISELKILDMYWSDHCRHTTFLTELKQIDITGQAVLKDGKLLAADMKSTRDQALYDALKLYMEGRKMVGRTKPVSLMDIATAAARVAKKKGLLDDIDTCDEINAASVHVPVNFANGRTEDWLFQFKNETHNHPTEISPYGGASTALGGCIRDPLSGRSYIFMGVRYIGTGDPDNTETIAGKISQRQINREATDGFAGYGNQIGVPTLKNYMAVHEGYRAKRFCAGCVAGATPADEVRREAPLVGDVILLLGGATGRDGIGGATGSSKAQDEKSVQNAGAEVQKGNPPAERFLMRLFRNPAFKKCIKKCNDGGAGGIANAVGEMADGVDISLDAVPLKYEGLTPTEIALSESQERMFVCVSAADVPSVAALSATENVPCAQVGIVIAEPTLRIVKEGETVAEIPRDIMEGWSNATQSASLSIASEPVKEIEQDWFAILQDKNICSKKPVQQRFDHCVGAGTVISPYDGKSQASPSVAAVGVFPATGASTVGIIAAGYDAQLSDADPFVGGALAVVQSAAAVVAAGANPDKIRISLQNYFASLGTDPARWGIPLAAQLGAYTAQDGLNTPAIGGKDSMSGTYFDSAQSQRIDVPPTLVSFAVGHTEATQVPLGYAQKADESIWMLLPQMSKSGLPEWNSLRKQFAEVHSLIASGHVSAIRPIEAGGAFVGLCHLLFGNLLGAKIEAHEALHAAAYGGFIGTGKAPAGATILGRTNDSGVLQIGNKNESVIALRDAWEQPLEVTFGKIIKGEKPQEISVNDISTLQIASPIGTSPKVFLPLFLGTNCEYETARAFELAGGIPSILPFNNQSKETTTETLSAIVQGISQSEILMLSGGFSAGDQPAGSAKFIANVLRNEAVKAAVQGLLSRGGLVLGVCNGFQALMKSGLLPYGKIALQDENAPTLAWNTCGHFISGDTGHAVKSRLSPWLSAFALDEKITIPIAHGEGRFIASNEQINQLVKNGQIGLQYTENINGSAMGIAGVSDETGQIFGMMAHPERAIGHVRKSAQTPNRGLDFFRGGINYFA